MDQILPKDKVVREDILNNFEMEEIQLLHQLFDNIILRSKTQVGMDRDVFVKLSPVPGLWGHRIYKFIKSFGYHEVIEVILFEDFLKGLRALCRSTDDELDHTIFKMFDLCDNKVLTKIDMV